MGTLLASFQSLERFAYPRRLSKELIIGEMNKHRAFFAEQGIDLKILKQRLFNCVGRSKFSRS